MSEATEAIEEVLRIVDMFADENREMGTDTVLSRATGALTDVRAEEQELLGLTHCGAYHGAKNIGNAIRERFGLPAREDI
jgi:hypothetical protein